MQMIDAEVPAGAAPGSTFMVQTPSGLVPVQVPPDAVPGQHVQFSVVQPSAPPAPATMGTVVGAGGYRSGRQYRVNPHEARVDNLPLLQGIPVKDAERKVQEIHKGAHLARERPPFPEHRPLQDAIWTAPFALACAVVIFGAIWSSGKLPQAVFDEGEQEALAASSMAAAGAAGGAASMLAALGFAFLAQRSPACVVWTSLVFGPFLWIAGGGALMAAGQVFLGAICMALGAFTLCCVFTCYRSFIPFMIKIVEAVSGVVRENPMMLLVSVIGSLLSIAWSLACGMSIAGMQAKLRLQESGDNETETYILFAVALLIFIWGIQVFYNVCHVTYCGVFARWYFKKEEEVALRRSIRAAMTTSFGSICFGSFLIAAVRVMQALVRQARANAQEDGNAICCIVLLMLECFVSCIGDILEYFSEWAYVQCAVRGVSFVDAARITYSMVTCSNVEYIIQDLLINSVVSLGALLCGAVGAAVGAAAGCAMQGGELAAAGAIIGLFAGLLSGGAAIGVLSSGTKTILALWAEDPEPLRRARPDMHEEFEQRILGKLSE
mmetsp:Transcript_19162/g.55592  ORF Transcript_19162/g.55592 Transcript_19162/m.55592 type:complete len:551 (-) Transcript_19162:105-1757(-)